MSVFPGIMTKVAGSGAYECLKAHVLAATGLAYFESRDEQFGASLSRRMEATGCATHRDYLDMLLDVDSGEREMQQLVQLLTVGETYFFRHTQIFEELRTRVIPTIIRENERTRSIRVWSAACSIGAEPYSIAATFIEHFPAVARNWDVSIIGTDINHEYVETARVGVYDPWALRSVPESLRARHFEPEGKRWRVREACRKLVTFAPHNLVRDLPPPARGGQSFDLIFCRNIMIYFSQEVATDVVPRLHDAMREGGWLVVGAAEVGFHALNQFQNVHADGAVLYRKGESQSRKAHHAPHAREPQPHAETLPQTPPSHPLAKQPSVPARPAQIDPLELAEAGDLPGAIATCEEQLRLARYDGVMHLTHGLLLQRGGHLNGAETAFRRALFLDRRLVMAQIGLAVTLERSGRDREAARHFAGALTLLEGLSSDDTVAYAEGNTVRDLRAVVQGHLGQEVTA